MKKDSKNQKIERLKQIISGLEEAKLDALLALLDVNPVKEYQFPEEEENLIAEGFARYERGETKGIPARESIRMLRAHLKKNTIEQ